MNEIKSNFMSRHPVTFFCPIVLSRLTKHFSYVLFHKEENLFVKIKSDFHKGDKYGIARQKN